MALRTRTRTRNDDVVEKGTSLARGPALIIGTALLAFGLLGFLQDATTPASSSFPGGSVNGGTWFGFEINGWTNFFTAAAGGLLLFGAAQHLLAKTMSLLVGLALGACAVIALIDGDVLGLAAANGWTELGWGIAAAVLLVNALLPRTGRRVAEPAAVAEPAGAGTTRTARDRPIAPAPAASAPVTQAPPAAAGPAPRDRGVGGERAADPVTTVDGDGAREPDTTVGADRGAVGPDTTVREDRGAIGQDTTVSEDRGTVGPDTTVREDRGVRGPAAPVDPTREERGRRA